MTCVVGIVGDGKIYFGADSQATSGYSKYQMKNDKVFKKTFQKTSKSKIEEIEMIFGCSGSIRMTQIIQHILKMPIWDSEKDEHQYLIQDFIPELVNTFSKNGFLKTVSGEISNCYFMLGFNEKIFVIHDDFQAFESASPYVAIGHGQDYAYGSMFTNLENKNKNYVQILNDALKASANFDTTVSGPFKIDSI